jgi:hypothetical protein
VRKKIYVAECRLIKLFTSKNTAATAVLVIVLLLSGVQSSFLGDLYFVDFLFDYLTITLSPGCPINKDL